MKELPMEFIGRGEVKGWTFRQIMKNDHAYIYSVENDDGPRYYEVFLRKENTRFNTISYPKCNAFGVWAWCESNMEAAEKRFKKISEWKKNNPESPTV